MNIFERFLMIVASILLVIGVGTLSYSYFSQLTPRPQVVQEAPVVVEKKEVSKPSTTSVAVVPKKVVAKTQAEANSPLVVSTTTIEKTVVAPGPLRAITQTLSATDLTVKGVIERTNFERVQNGGLPALTENATLNRDAQMKVDDMFARQYFEHVSPTGVGPADLAQAVGYAYVIVGENLALGDFGSDSGVVTAWMNSPGHRANILNSHYQEIGVAVGKGMYEGRMTWLAVQSFGMPLSACPAISVSLKVEIDTNNVTISGLRAQLDAKKAQIDATPTHASSYNTYVNEFNAIVPQYNALVETNRANVSTYNAGVQAFNACIATTSGH